MKKYILFPMFFVLFGWFYSGQILATTEISWIIEKDTTWNTEHSPYIVTSDLLINENVILTIEPGVIVKFQRGAGVTRYQILNRGKIIAKGNPSNKIIFTSNETTPIRGDWKNIESEDQGVIDFDYVEIHYPSYGILSYNDLTLTNSLITNCGVGVYIAGSVYINNNIIKYCSSGINISGEVEDSKITHNTIRDIAEQENIYNPYQAAIVFDRTSVNEEVELLEISNNNIYSNSTALKFTYTSSMEQIVVYNNNIFDNYLYSVRLDESISSEGLNISNNWWGTIDRSLIDNSVYDGNDDFHINTVKYEPVLSEFVINTPAIEYVAPSIPIIDDFESPTTRSAMSISGKKDYTTSIWINGVMAYDERLGNSWSYYISSLAIDENKFEITSKDKSGNESDPLVITIERKLPTCTLNDYSCNNWNECSIIEEQTRTCTKISECEGGESIPETSQKCTYMVDVCTSWKYADWGTCSEDGRQTRSIFSSFPEGCVGGSPVLIQECISNMSCSQDIWNCSEWNPCQENNTQTRQCVLTQDCSNISFASPTTNQTCTYNNIVSDSNSNTDKNTDTKTSNQSIQKDLNSEKENSSQNTDDALVKRLKGTILLKVESHGEAYYINPENKKGYYLGRPGDAFNIMRKLGLGATHEFITSYTVYPDHVSGKILLDVEKNGEAYYIYPKDKKAYYLGRPSDAFDIMRKLGLGITNNDIRKIDVGNL